MENTIDKKIKRAGLRAYVLGFMNYRLVSVNNVDVFEKNGIEFTKNDVLNMSEIKFLERLKQELLNLLA